MTDRPAADIWRLEADGASLGNPGPAGAGAVVYDPAGRPAAEISEPLGTRATNNEAEYQALLLGLKALISLGAGRISIQMDSELVVRQVQGLYRVKNPRLGELFREVKSLLAQFDGYEIAHIRRAGNRPADALAGQAAQKAKSGRTRPEIFTPGH